MTLPKLAVIILTPTLNRFIFQNRTGVKSPSRHGYRFILISNINSHYVHHFFIAHTNVFIMANSQLSELVMSPTFNLTFIRQSTGVISPASYRSDVPFPSNFGRLQMIPHFIFSGPNCTYTCVFFRFSVMALTKLTKIISSPTLNIIIRKKSTVVISPCD